MDKITRTEYNNACEIVSKYENAKDIISRYELQSNDYPTIQDIIDECTEENLVKIKINKRNKLGYNTKFGFISWKLWNVLIVVDYTVFSCGKDTPLSDIKDNPGSCKIDNMQRLLICRNFGKKSLNEFREIWNKYQ